MMMILILTVNKVLSFFSYTPISLENITIDHTFHLAGEYKRYKSRFISIFFLKNKKKTLEMKDSHKKNCKYLSSKHIDMN